MSRIAAFVAVLAVALLPAPAPAWHTDGVLVLTGSKTASTTLTMPARSGLELDDFFDEGPVVTGGRDLAGFVITDERGEIVYYDVTARVAHDGELLRGTPLAAGPEKVRMRPSRDDDWRRFFDTRRYTITLLADAPVTVRIKVRGMRGRTLRPSLPVATATFRGPFLPTLAQPRGEARLGLSLRRTSTVLLYTDHATTGYGGEVQWLCVVDPGRPCDDSGDTWAKRTSTLSVWCFFPCGTTVRDSEGSGFHWMVRPGHQGGAEAVARSDKPLGVTTDGRAFALVLG